MHRHPGYAQAPPGYAQAPRLCTDTTRLCTGTPAMLWHPGYAQAPPGYVLAPSAMHRHHPDIRYTDTKKRRRNTTSLHISYYFDIIPQP